MGSNAGGALKWTMSRKPYDWRHGPAEIQQHSVAKNRLLANYLSHYLQTLASQPQLDELKLTLVDGFCGGGTYIHADSHKEELGSPFVLLNAVKEASFLLNKDRRKPISLNVSYFFIDNDPHAISFLKHNLSERGHGNALESNIFLKNAAFHDNASQVIEFIKKKSPKNGRSIFVLDQYGYNKVPAELLRRILGSLPSAEIILTFGVDSFLNYASDDSNITDKLLREIGLTPQGIFAGRSIQEIKNSEREWRLFIQSHLYRHLVDASGAQHHTPFFIRTERGHGDYWLVHLSQHPRARDVMAEIHWKHGNQFIHYGGAGINMFHMAGYDARHDSQVRGQYTLDFGFDDIAQRMSVDALTHDLPHLIYSHDTGLSFGELFVATCNGSPASASIYKKALEYLINTREIVITSADGNVRRSANSIQATDQIVAPTQRNIVFV